MTRPDYLIDGQDSAPLTLVFTHGAGAPMDSNFMNWIALGVAAAGFRVVRFEFPYMLDRRETGIKKPPNRLPILMDTWNTVIADLGAETLVVGGKSMGGRIASMVADDAKVRGVVCLGYPFHPPGKPEKMRTEHLIDLKTPALFCQGERDPFGTKDEVPGFGISKGIQMHWAPDGDHGLKPRKKSGFTEEQNIADAVDTICSFMKKL